MDPNIALDKLRELARVVLNDPTEDGDAHAADDMATLFEALDQCLSNAGYLPSEWQDARKP